MSIPNQSSAGLPAPAPPPGPQDESEQEHQDAEPDRCEIALPPLVRGTDEVAEDGVPDPPHHRAGDVVQEEPPPPHMRHPGQDEPHTPHERDEPAQEHGLPPVAPVIPVSPFQAFGRDQQPAPVALQETATEPPADQVADVVPQDGADARGD